MQFSSKNSFGHKQKHTDAIWFDQKNISFSGKNILNNKEYKGNILICIKIKLTCNFVCDSRGQHWTTNAKNNKNKKMHRENLTYSPVSQCFFFCIRLSIGDSLSIFDSIYVVHIAHYTLHICSSNLCSMHKRLLVFCKM